MKPIVAFSCGWRAASATTRTQSARSSDSGFSQNTCLPACKRIDDLLRVQRRRRHEQHRVDVAIRQQRRIIVVAVAAPGNVRAPMPAPLPPDCTRPRAARPARDTPGSPRGACRAAPDRPRRHEAAAWPPSSRRLAEFDRAALAPRRVAASASSSAFRPSARWCAPACRASSRRRSARFPRRTRRGSARGKTLRACRSTLRFSNTR